MTEQQKCATCGSVYGTGGAVGHICMNLAANASAMPYGYEIGGRSAPTPDTPTRDENSELLAEFTAYCHAHPTERFWQALRNWSGNGFILVAAGSLTIPSNMRDTFYSNERGGGAAGGTEDDEAGAIAAWNRRADSTEDERKKETSNG